MLAKNLKIKIIGKVHASFLRRETNSYELDGETIRQEVTYNESMKKRIIEVLADCF